MNHFDKNLNYSRPWAVCRSIAFASSDPDHGHLYFKMIPPKSHLNVFCNNRDERLFPSPSTTTTNHLDLELRWLCVLGLLRAQRGTSIVIQKQIAKCLLIRRNRQPLISAYNYIRIVRCCRFDDTQRRTEGVQKTGHDEWNWAPSGASGMAGDMERMRTLWHRKKRELRAKWDPFMCFGKQK